MWCLVFFASCEALRCSLSLLFSFCSPRLRLPPCVYGAPCPPLHGPVTARLVLLPVFVAVDIFRPHWGPRAPADEGVSRHDEDVLESFDY